MNKTWKTKWIKALKSGKYEQGSGDLRIDNKYCCLGVFCDIYDSQWWVKTIPGSYNYQSKSGNIPSQIRTEVEITEIQQERLIDLNDLENYNFQEIADWIEKNL